MMSQLLLGICLPLSLDVFVQYLPNILRLQTAVYVITDVHNWSQPAGTYTPGYLQCEQAICTGTVDINAQLLL
jgi:hypothetical protein